MASYDDMKRLGYVTSKEIAEALRPALDALKDYYNQDAILGIMFETDEDRTCRQKLIEVNQVVDAHRLNKMKAFIEQHKLTTWRRENGFDLQPVVRGKPPPTREEDNASLRFQLQELRDMISSHTKDLDLSPESHAVLERVEPTLVATEQQCLDAPSDPCVILEDKESKEVMSPTLDNKQQSSLADTGIEAPKQQSTSQGGMWEAGMINAGGSLHADISFSPRVDSSSPTKKLKRTSTLTGIFSRKKGEQVAAIEEAAITQHRKETSDENKQFDPGREVETIPFPVGPPRHGLFCFSPCLAFLSSCFLCVCFLACIFACPQFQFFLIQVINEHRNQLI